MRFPRPRLSVRRLIGAMLILVALPPLAVLEYRSSRFEKKAVDCRTVAEMHEGSAAWVRQFKFCDPPHAGEYEEFGRRFDRWAAHFWLWEMTWRDAASHPWRAGPIPEPAPE